VFFCPSITSCFFLKGERQGSKTPACPCAGEGKGFAYCLSLFTSLQKEGEEKERMSNGFF